MANPPVAGSSPGRQTKQQREKRAEELANDLARQFNRLCEAAGIDLPLQLCLFLVEMFRPLVNRSLELADLEARKSDA